ncbi:hypothetical protein ESZ36_08625 [Colwellia demingiae]|uniref:TauD/TfdA-like domain-containing protein n=1 Tax=Colwellia demingiae TaxID=89401 RepID=A0A5C6QI20_9GAMM|nr:TauD/TfdA family dioxygenase [Colwellia demingiae]TWX68549.1 hypothetical protein ESZ36_08625 [Colwellia demingiae]
MTILKLSKLFQDNQQINLKQLDTKDEYRDYIKNNKSFTNLISSIKTILKEDKYIIVRGLVSDSDKFFEVFVEEFGLFYGAVEKTGIKIDCDYTGCNRKALGLHNDDAIDIKNQPKFGFIQVTNPDPVLHVMNGIVIISELVNKLKYENPDLLKSLLNNPVPMLSYGVNYVDKNNDEIVINEPVLYKKNNEYHVRFDDSRIGHFYYKNKLAQSSNELDMIEKFIKVSHSIKHEFHLECGDILIHDNLTTLHDRSECSIEINFDGSFNTREIRACFAR